MTRPARYTENSSSRDWIDEFCATSSADEVRGAFRFTIGKYLRRYGKKDDPLQEAIKIQDYANRLVEFERAQMAVVKDCFTSEPAPAFAGLRCMVCQAPGGHGGLQCPTIQPFSSAMLDAAGRQFEPASLIDDESPRMQAIGQNGPSGEHYDELLELAEVAILNGGAPIREPQRPRHQCMACGLGHATHLCGAGQ